MSPVSSTASSGRPLRADAARNRALLLDAARAAFGRDGVGASLDDIARSAGVGPGTLYRHFPTRDALVLTVIDDGLLGLRDLGVDLLHAAAPLDALRRWLDAYIDQGGMFVGLANTLVAPSSDGPSAACSQSREAGAALFARARDAGEIRDDLGFDDVIDMAAAIMWVGERPDRSRAQRDRLLDLLVRGLRP